MQIKHETHTSKHLYKNQPTDMHYSKLGNYDHDHYKLPPPGPEATFTWPEWKHTISQSTKTTIKLPTIKLSFYFSFYLQINL